MTMNYSNLKAFWIIFYHLQKNKGHSQKWEIFLKGVLWTTKKKRRRSKKTLLELVINLALTKETFFFTFSMKNPIRHKIIHRTSPPPKS